jgi:hypothetical protein
VISQRQTGRDDLRAASAELVNIVDVEQLRDFVLDTLVHVSASAKALRPCDGAVIVRHFGIWS